MKLFEPKNTKIMILLLMVVSLIGLVSFTYGQTVSENADPSYVIEHVNELQAIPANTQWFINNNRQYAATINSGEIIIYTEQDNVWSEVQRLVSESSQFTTYQVKDIDNDQSMEIIAGTSDPGFIFIYKLNQENLWNLTHYNKHLWAAITNIVIGSFSGVGLTEIVAQTQDSSLYLLRVSDKSLDLIWKSPSPWKPVQSFNPVDLDNDGTDELVGIYKNGSVALMKVINNTVTSFGDNFPWGKILVAMSGDLNCDGLPEFILSTSQKITYVLNFNGKKPFFKQAPLQFDYFIENMYFLNSTQLIVSDTSGRLHLFEYIKNKWQETAAFQSGRISKINKSLNENEVYLWEPNNQVLTFKKLPLNFDQP